MVSSVRTIMQNFLRYTKKSKPWRAMIVQFLMGHGRQENHSVSEVSFWDALYARNGYSHPLK